MRPIMMGFLVLAACGSAEKLVGKGKKSSSTPAPAAAPAVDHHSMAFADAAALPPCNAAAEGWLVYLSSEKKFQVCTSGAWADAPVSSPSDHIGEALTCAGLLDGTQININYSAVQLGTGDVFVTGCVGSGSMDVCKSGYYASSSAGAALAAIAFTDDLMGASNAGYWILTADRTTLIVSAEYHDADAPGGQQSFSLPASDCTLNKY